MPYINVLYISFAQLDQKGWKRRDWTDGCSRSFLFPASQAVAPPLPHLGMLGGPSSTLRGSPGSFSSSFCFYRVDPKTLFSRRASRGFVLSPCCHMGGTFNIAPSIRAPPGGLRQINFLTILFLVGRPLFGRCFRLSEFHVLLLLLLLYHHPLSSSSSPPGVNLSCSLSSASFVRRCSSLLFNFLSGSVRLDFP